MTIKTEEDLEHAASLVGKSIHSKADESQIKRDKKGRFLPGSSGLGRHGGHKRKLTIYDIVSQDQVRDLVGKVYEIAMKGDMKALTYLLDHCLGKPDQNVNISGQLLQGVVHIDMGNDESDVEDAEIIDIDSN